MANLVRRLKQWPTLHQQGCACAAPHHLVFLPLLPVTKFVSRHLSLTTVPLTRRGAQQRSGGFRLPNAPVPSSFEERNGSDLDSDVRKSRNQLKRDARRAVRWGMELASFSNPQIKRILRCPAKTSFLRI